MVFPCDHGQDGDHRRTVDVPRLLLAAGRPVFIPAYPLKPFNGGTILVAWKNCREARRAVLDALPVLTKAAQVVVLSVQEEDQAPDLSLEDLVSNLTRHAVRARALRERRPTLSVGATLNSVARSLGADLIVAGAYGHSRLREWIFGGVTRSLLDDNSQNRLLSN